MLKGRGFDPAALEARFEAIWANDATAAGYRDADEPTPSAELEAVLTRASRSRGILFWTPLSAFHLLDAALEEPTVKDIFARPPFDPATIERAAREAIDREADALPAAPADIEEVVFHNDDRTTMELVVEVLITAFAFSRTAAVKAMLTVHKTGSVAVGSYPREEARERAARAVAIARKGGFPLRITCRPIPADSSH